MVTSFVFLLPFYGILGIYANSYARTPEGSISIGAPWHLFTFLTTFNWAIIFAFSKGWKEIEDLWYVVKIEKLLGNLLNTAKLGQVEFIRAIWLVYTRKIK